MKLNMACNAQPGHKEFVRKHTGLRPTVLSSKRYEGIMSRSRQDERREVLAAIEEEQRYKQYLRDGSDALCKCFTNMGSHQAKDEDALQATRDKLLKEKTKDQRAKQLWDELRKERIMRAKQILHQMKPGPRSLQQALLQSEMIKQRKYYDAVNEDIAKDAVQQKRLEDQQCPEILIPYSQYNNEEQEKAEQMEKSRSMRAYFLQDLEERRQRKLSERKQEIYDAIIEREKCKCLQEKEDKAAKELAAKKREFCRRAYKDAVQEKAEIAKFEEICEQIDDRIKCVNQVAQRNLDVRYGKHVVDLRAQQIRNREAMAVKVCQLQQEMKKKDETIQANREEVYQAEVDMDEMRRKCHTEELSRKRKLYEQEERKEAEEKKLRDEDVRRFEIATRLKNVEANKRFFNAEKERQEKVTKDLREALFGQRQQFMQQRQDERMRVTACEEDPNLQDDVEFFDQATEMVEESQELGRPLYPLAKAVHNYQRDNQIDIVPQRQMKRRNTTRDICWPGYFSKAEFAYKNYEHREKCRQENDKERHKIFDNCMKITKMAAAERPFQSCVQSGLVKCADHKCVPVLDNFQARTQAEDKATLVDSVGLLVTVSKTNSQPDEKNVPTTVDKKLSKVTIVSTPKRGAGGLDILPDSKRDGISRSLLGVVSTKQRPPCRFPDVRNNLDSKQQDQRSVGSSVELLSAKEPDAFPRGSPLPSVKTNLTKQSQSRQQHSARSAGSDLLSASVIPRSSTAQRHCRKLPDLKRYLTSRPQTQRKESSRSAGSSAKESALFSDPKRTQNLPDLTRYLNSKPQSKCSIKSCGVADLLTPDNISGRFAASRKQSRKLPDLTQYWTRKQKFDATKGQSNVFPLIDRSGKANKSNSKFTWPANGKQCG